jgi:hypothetical protein
MVDAILTLPWKDLATGIAAFVGMVLGIFNFMRARADDKVRLRVVPKATELRGVDPDGRLLYHSSVNGFPVSDQRESTLAVEIRNLSKFAVTVDEVGLKSPWTRERIVLATPIIPDKGAWPRRLEPREVVTVHFNTLELMKLRKLSGLRRAYAATACGTTCFGSSKALRAFARIGATARHNPRRDQG